jgi:TonB family protein
MVRRPSVSIAFLSAILLHLAALTAVSFLWEPLRAPAPMSHLIPAELVAVEPTGQPSPVAEPEENTPPIPESLPIDPTPQESITSPQVVEQKRVEPPPKPLASKKPSPKEPSTRSRQAEGAPDLPFSSGRINKEKSKPGPFIPSHDDAPETPGGNTLGRSPMAKAQDMPQNPIEGGEAGAGKLFERGDVPVVPGSGTGGGSGGPGTAGLGLDAERGETRAGGRQSGSGGEGPGEGLGGSSGVRGGYQVKPRYPDSARRQGVEGTVLLKARVTERGRVDEVEIETSAGHPELDQAAIEALRRWRFEPARRGREPVAAWVLIPFQFKLQ